MRRRNFLREGGLYSAILALFNTQEVIAADDSSELKRLKEQRDYFVNRHAVMYDILRKELDAEKLKQVYLRFGKECAIHWGAVHKTEPYNGDLEKYLEELPSIDK